MTTLSEEEPIASLNRLLRRLKKYKVPEDDISDLGEAIGALIAQREVNYRADLAQAIGYCQGLGHPNSYLEKRYPELAFQTPEQERMV